MATDYAGHAGLDYVLLLARSYLGDKVEAERSRNVAFETRIHTQTHTQGVVFKERSMERSLP